MGHVAGDTHCLGVSVVLYMLDIGLLDAITLYRFTKDERSGRQNIECLVFDGLAGAIIGKSG